jgi:two-component system nitrate/nitrite sensor histidine kinase NarX
MDHLLTEHINRVSGSPVPVLLENEVTVLKARLSQLEAELESAQLQASSQAKNLEGLLLISEAGGDLSSLEAIFESTLDTVLNLTGMPSGIIRQWEEHIGAFVMMAARGLTPQIIEEVGLIPSEDGIDGMAAHTLWPVVMEDMRNDERNRSPGALAAGYHSLICVPLIARQELIGTLVLLNNKHYHWRDEEIRWLAAIGRQAGCVIAYIKLTERVRDLAIIEERARLSRELHDGLSQMVGALRLRAEEVQACMEEGDLEAVAREIQKLSLIAKDVYANLRDEMIGLRIANRLDNGLVKLLAEQLARFQRQWGIETELHTNLCDHPECELPQPMEVQILRIVQEALVNVRRHASATLIHLTLEDCQDWVHLRILDNGCGFDPQKVAPDRLGLQILRERAASQGGSLKVWSKLGEGTCLEVNFPKHPSQLLAKGILHEHHLIG